MLLSQLFQNKRPQMQRSLQQRKGHSIKCPASFACKHKTSLWRSVQKLVQSGLVLLPQPVRRSRTKLQNALFVLHIANIDYSRQLLKLSPYRFSHSLFWSRGKLSNRIFMFDPCACVSYFTCNTTSHPATKKE